MSDDFGQNTNIENDEKMSLDVAHHVSRAGKIGKKFSAQAAKDWLQVDDQQSSNFL